MYSSGFIVVSTCRLGICCPAACVLACVECPATAPRLGESCDLWCTRASVRRKPAGGSEQRWRKTQLVARTSGNSSRCRWTAGERASSRDARDTALICTTGMVFAYTNTDKNSMDGHFSENYSFVDGLARSQKSQRFALCGGHP